MSSVDQRIVEMQFNNKQFESGIKTSMQSLSQLEKGLQLKGAANGLSELDRATKKLSLGNLGNSVDFIASKFTALGIMGVTALQNIANQAYHAGERIVKSLTIEPVMAGFSEYETQINAIQTILANTQKDGTTLDDVTVALDELNAYADKTIYNFTEMTRNIGTFTAAGVKLDTATNAIQGIANLAAISGSNSQQASTAMYQLSQAMASGTVKLMDWNSVVNAGMGGQVFQDALKETAKAHGVAIDDMIKKHGSFRETLSEGWITTDVLTETLEKFTATTEGLTAEQVKANREMWKARGYTDEQIDAIFEMGKTATDAATKVKTFTQLFDTLKEAAQSGWTQSWEILIGDFEEAKTLLTSISDTFGDIINKSAQSRNALLQGWKDAGGRDDLLAGFKNIFEALKSVVTPVKEAFQEMFPPATVDQLVSFTKGFREMTEGLLKWNDVVTPLKGGMLDFAEASFETAEHNVKLQSTINKIVRVFKGFFAIIDIGVQGVKALASGFGKLLGKAAPVADDLLGMAASLGDFLVELSGTIRETGFFETAMDGIASAIGFVVDAFKKLSSKGAEAFKFVEDVDLSGIEIKIEPITALADAWTWVLGKLEAAYLKALPFFNMIGSYAGEAFGKFSEAVGGFVKDGGLTELTQGGLLTALIVLVTKVAKAFENIGDSLGGIFEGLSDVVDGVTGSLEAMQNKLNAEALKEIAIAVGILAGSLALLSIVDSTGLGAAFSSITMMFVEIIGALAAVSEISSGAKMAKMLAAATAMKSIATAVLVLAAAMALLGTVDSSSMAGALISMVTLMGMMVLVTQKLSDGSVGAMKGAASLIAFAVAIGVLAVAVALLGSMDIGALAQGVGALAAMIITLCAAIKYGNIGAVSLSAGLGLMAMASAILILAGAILLMSMMDIDAIAKGLGVMLVSIIALTYAAEALPTNLISAGVGLMAIAAAIAIIGVAMHILGSLSFEQMAVGLISMAGALTIMVVAANTMTGSLAGAAAILVMAGALIALGAALKLMGSMSVESLVTAFVAMAVSLTAIGVAAALLGPVAPMMLALAAGILALSVAVGVGGVALMAFGAGLTAVGAGITALVAGIVAAISGLVSGIATIAIMIGESIVAVANVIFSVAPVVEEAAKVLVETVVAVLVNGVTAIANSLAGAIPSILLLAGVLAVLGVAALGIVPMVPAMIAVSAALVAFGVSCATIAAGVTLLAGALALLGASGLLVAASLTDIYTTISAMGDLSLDAVTQSAHLFNEAGEVAAEAIMEGLSNGLSNSGDVFGSSLGSALQNGIKSVGSGMTSALTSLANSGATALMGSYGRFQSIGAAIASRMIAGVSSGRGSATGAVAGIVGGMQSVLNSSQSAFYSIGGYIVRGLANGIRANSSVAISAARELGAAVENATKSAVDVNSPSRDFEDIGMWIDMGLANGLIKFAKLATNAAAYLGESTIQPVMTMTDNMLSDIGSMGSALRGTAALASSLDSSITSEQYVTVNHTFEDLTVKGVNDRNEFVAVANYSVEEMMTELMRKGIRR